jgi:hypothetical protein
MTSARLEREGRVPPVGYSLPCIKGFRGLRFGSGTSAPRFRAHRPPLSRPYGQGLERKDAQGPRMRQRINGRDTGGGQVLGRTLA